MILENPSSNLWLVPALHGRVILFGFFTSVTLFGGPQWPFRAGIFSLLPRWELCLWGWREKSGRNPSRKSLEAAVAGKRPIIISADNGFDYLDEAFAFLKNGGDTLEAALKVVKGPEDDPNDDSVGLGGLPNEEGVVELDSCCMHGPTRRAGSVGGVRNIKNVSQVAHAVMEHTGHVMLVGEGAERFAVAMGFPRENLLTEHSRKIWLLWKESHSDWWGPGLSESHWHKRMPAAPHADDFERSIERMKQVAADIGIEPEQRMVAIRKVLFPPTGTIHCSALNEKGEMSGITTTSGLALKLPGRVRRFSDHRRRLLYRSGRRFGRRHGQRGREHQGRGSAYHRGKHAPRHVAAGCGHGRAEAHRAQLQRRHGPLRFMDMTYYVLRKDGAYAGVSLWEGLAGKPHKIAVHDGTKRLGKDGQPVAGFSQEWPPVPP